MPTRKHVTLEPSWKGMLRRLWSCPQNARPRHPRYPPENQAGMAFPPRSPPRPRPRQGHGLLREQGHATGRGQNRVEDTMPGPRHNLSWAWDRIRHATTGHGQVAIPAMPQSVMGMGQNPSYPFRQRGSIQSHWPTKTTTITRYPLLSPKYRQIRRYMTYVSPEKAR